MTHTKPSLLKITSLETLDAAVARIVRLKIDYTAARAAADQEIAAIEKARQVGLGQITEAIAREESAVQDYCLAHRAQLFETKKSRDTALATIGFEYTPHRVETTSRKIKFSDVITRLLRLGWGQAYVKYPLPTLDKNALLSDREKLTPEQLTAAGITFTQDEQFFIRPKPESALPLSA